MTVKVSNNASTLLTTSMNTTDLTFSVTAASGSKFPTIASPDNCYITISNAAGAVEIVEISAHISGADAFTIVSGGRGADGSTAQSWSIGDYVELCPVAAVITELQAEKVSKDTTDEDNSFSGASLTFNYGGASDIDEIHYDESTNTYHFTADTTRAANGNAAIYVGGINLAGTTLTVNGTELFNLELAAIARRFLIFSFC